MSLNKLPLEIDLIECLYGDGEVSIDIVLKMADSAHQAWQVIEAMTLAQTASLWLVDDNTARQLEHWEIASLTRSTRGSGEPSPPSASIRVRPGPLTAQAYHRDFGAWYNRTLGDKST